MDNLLDIGLNKLLVARKSEDSFIIGSISRNKGALTFTKQFENVRPDGSISPIGVLSCPLESHYWDTLTFYGPAHIKKKFPSSYAQHLKSIKTEQGVPLWNLVRSYYRAFEFLLSINMMPIVIDRLAALRPTTVGSANIQGPVVCNFPLAEHQEEIQRYLDQVIKTELSTIRVQEKDLSDEKMRELFKDFL